MAIKSFPDRAPGDVSEFTLGFGKNPKTGLSFLDKGEVIVGEPIVTIVPDTLTPVSVNQTAGNVTVWLGGEGTDGESHTIRCKLTTSKGRTFTRSGKVKTTNNL